MASKRVFYTEGDFYAYISENPVSYGHSVLAYRKHAVFGDMDKNSIRAVGPLVKRISIAVKEATGAEGVKLIIENGDMQPVELFGLFVVKGVNFDVKDITRDSAHMHIDIVPCYADMSKFNIERKPFDESTNAEILKKIKGELES